MHVSSSREVSHILRALYVPMYKMQFTNVARFISSTYIHFVYTIIDHNLFIQMVFAGASSMANSSLLCLRAKDDRNGYSRVFARAGSPSYLERPATNHTDGYVSSATFFARSWEGDINAINQTISTETPRGARRCASLVNCGFDYLLASSTVVRIGGAIR